MTVDLRKIHFDLRQGCGSGVVVVVCAGRCDECCKRFEVACRVRMRRGEREKSVGVWDEQQLRGRARSASFWNLGAVRATARPGGLTILARCKKIMPACFPMASSSQPWVPSLRAVATCPPPCFGPAFRHRHVSLFSLDMCVWSKDSPRASCDCNRRKSERFIVSALLLCVSCVLRLILISGKWRGCSCWSLRWQWVSTAPLLRQSWRPTTECWRA